MRTTYGLGPAPVYSARSQDSGKTWSKPMVFDKVGVWPRLLALKCGVTLASYGRPGLYLRATNDPTGQKWENPIIIITPSGVYDDTCAYSALMALDDNTALMVYSDFKHKIADGSTRKAIQVRRLTIPR